MREGSALTSDLTGKHARSQLSFFFFFSFMKAHSERERAETQAEGEAGSMHREPDVGFYPGSPGSRPGTKVGATLLRHPGIPEARFQVAQCLWQ